MVRDNIIRLLVILLLPLTLVAQAQVDSVFPTQNAINIPGNTNIIVRFDTAMDSATINDTTFLVFGNISGIHLGSITYDSGTKTATLNPVADFVTGEIITAIATNAIADSGGTPIEGYVWSFTIIVPGGTGYLANPDNYAVDNGPHGIYTSLLNNDNNLDLIVANVNSQDYSILLGNGDGTFASAVQHTTGLEPHAVVCGDLDQDIDNDWIIVSKVEDKIYVYLNDGAGNGNLVDTCATGGDPVTAFLSDFNRDGNLDIATANRSSNDFSVLLGNGDGTFQPSTEYTVGPSPSGIYGGDFDHDGDIDMAVTKSNNRFTVFTNNGDGTYSTVGDFNTGAVPRGAFAAAFNSADNFLDLTSANINSNNVSVLLGNGDATFRPSVQYQTLIAPVHLYCTDMDADLDLDIIAANSGSDSISILLNDGNGNFSSPHNFGGGDSVMVLCAGDFDNDGAMDVAVACFNADNIAVLLSSSDTVRPYVVSTVPDSGEAGIALNSDINITFSEPMDTASLDTSKFHVSGSISPVYTYVLIYDSLNNSVRLNPDSLFAIDETIMVDVSQAVTDTVGNSMDTSYSFYFITAATLDTIPPQVVSTVPDSGDVDVATSITISVVFSERIDAATITNDKIQIDGSIGGSYGFLASYSDADSTLTIDPDSNFALHESITVYIDSGIQDLAGNLMRASYGWWFITGGGEFLPAEMVYAWPNPARGDSVYFHFYVSTDADVTVDIFNIIGKRIVRLEGRGEGGRTPHQQSSNAIGWNISNIASDVYIFKLTAVSDASGEEVSVIKKFAVIR